jgi:hypothetical protein
LLAATTSKFTPVIDIVEPALPEVGVIAVIAGACKYVNTGPVAVPPVVVTVTAPVLPPTGAVTTNEPLLADVTTAAAPLNFTVLAEAVVLKPEPLMVTAAPARPVDGEMAVIAGAGTGLFFLQPANIERAVKMSINE